MMRTRATQRASESKRDRVYFQNEVPVTVATIPHVVIDDKGVARIAGSRIKVTHIARDHLGGGMSPEQIVAAYPHLTLGQIHAALAYYFDNRAVLDAQIEQSDREIDRLREEMGESDFVKRLRAEGKLP
jgi:uncharacterized protein (DUF433 family)